MDPAYDWITKTRGIPLDEIVAAPQIHKYRKESELNFGYCHEYGPAAAEEEPAQTNGQATTTTDTSAEPGVVPPSESAAAAATTNKRSITKTPAVGFMAPWPMENPHRTHLRPYQGVYGGMEGWDHYPSCIL